MKKLLFTFLIIILFISIAFAQEKARVLKVEEPGEELQKKRIVQMNVESLKKIFHDFKFEDVRAVIEFADSSGMVLAKLGKVKKGNIKWIQKMEGDMLNVKFKKQDYPSVLEKVTKKTVESGFQIQISNSKTMDILITYRITFLELPNLTVNFRYPFKIFSGEEIGKNVSITIENKGTSVAENFNVELVLSGDNQIPVQPAEYSENYKEDVLLKDGRMNVKSLKPGGMLNVEVKNSVKIPNDTEPKKYYLGVVVDPDNKIKEIDETDNINIGVIMVDITTPNKISLSLPRTSLVFKPFNRDIKIYWGSSLISDGKEWRSYELRPYLFQLKHLFWKDFHWEVDTFDRSVWKIKGAKFGSTGGSGKDLGIKVERTGGTKTISPTKIVLRLSQTKLDFEPLKGKFIVSYLGDIINYAALWRTCRVKSYIYQIMCVLWKDFFVEVNSFKKQVNMITGSKFCKPGGNSKPLDLKLEIE